MIRCTSIGASSGPTVWDSLPNSLIFRDAKTRAASAVTVAKGEKSVNALKLMALMGMGIKQGDTVKVTVEGADEDAAAAAIEAFFKANL